MDRKTKALNPGILKEWAPQTGEYFLVVARLPGNANFSAEY
jgi:hypothetical protein